MQRNEILFDGWYGMLEAMEANFGPKLQLVGDMWVGLRSASSYEGLK